MPSETSAFHSCENVLMNVTRRKLFQNSRTAQSWLVFEHSGGPAHTEFQAQQGTGTDSGSGARTTHSEDGFWVPVAKEAGKWYAPGSAHLAGRRAWRSPPPAGSGSTRSSARRTPRYPSADGGRTPGFLQGQRRRLREEPKLVQVNSQMNTTFTWPFIFSLPATLGVNDQI